MQRSRITLACLLFGAMGAGVGLAILRSGGAMALVARTEIVMATPITVQLPIEDAAEADVVFEVLRSVDRRMSEWKPSSLLSAVNAAAGVEAVPIPDDLHDVLRRGIELGMLTEGAFDITWAALWGVWDFRTETPVVPDAELIEARRALVDYRRVALDREAGTVFLPDAGMVLGLGGIAKGYALDAAGAALRARNVQDFLIEAGGQVTVGGMRGDRGWHVGVRDPRGAGDDPFAVLEISNASVATSGDYERFFEINGVRYHHVLDPRTGWPSRGVRSATVIAADATLADALSTALMILGVERGLALAESLDAVEAILVDDEAKAHLTSGAGDMIVTMRGPTE